MKASAKKPTNMAKTIEIIQKAGETPGQFYERLCKVYWIYTLFDLESSESQQMINTAFVVQSVPDSHRKLQKQEDFSGMNTTQLLEIANQVFVN